MMQRLGIYIVSVVLMILAQGAVRAEELTPTMRLRKLSLHIRGLVPAGQEYVELKNAQVRGELNSFFRQKAADYLDSPEHVAKMNVRMNELFRFKIPPVPVESYFEDIKSEKWKKGFELDPLANDLTLVDHASDSLFRDLISQNKSWDTILKSSEYRLRFTGMVPYERGGESFPLPDRNLTSYDQTFFEFLLSQKTWSQFYEPKNDSITIRLATPEGETMTAGAVTTHRFFNRYVDTSTNLARRRAAAVFNIFLCDEMRPVAIPSSEEDKQLLNESLYGGLISEHAEKMKSIGNDERRHGSDPACMSCHSKLDPLARVFRGIGNRLPSRPSDAALVYKVIKNGEEKSVSVPFRGFRGMADAIVAQEEYVACQVKHFWKWFIGQDVDPSEKTLSQLQSKFEELDRKPNDFIRYLVNRPEFYTKKAERNAAQESAREAALVLKDCTSCHQSSGISVQLYPWPMGGNAQNHQASIERIAKVTDLKHGGASASMPPDWSGWDPSFVKKSIQTLKTWICQGSPDESGKKTASIPEDQCGN